MALKVVSMAELRLEVLMEAERSGETVSAICKRHGISRQTFYEYRRRYLDEGLDGLEPRSRRPYHSPRQMDYDLEVEICKMRKDHPRWGARRIHTELVRAKLSPPAISTIHQALRRNHLVADQPKKRPKFTKRFEREVPNDLWQIDATQVRLANGRKKWVMDLLDDHARFLLAAVACSGPTGTAAWRCFEKGTRMYGQPRQVLSDNGTCFTGRLVGSEVEFEAKLKQIGVQLINSGPYHPQTLGKLERFHKTMKDWVEDEGPPTDLEHLQDLLDRFQVHYNQERPNQAIGDVTPWERYTGNLPEAIPRSDRPRGAPVALRKKEQPTYPDYSLVRQVSNNGGITFDSLQIEVGKRWVGALVRIIEVGELIHVYYGTELLRVLVPNRQRRYQALGRKAGRKVRPSD